MNKNEGKFYKITLKYAHIFDTMRTRYFHLNNMLDIYIFFMPFGTKNTLFIENKLGILIMYSIYLVASKIW